MFENNNIKKTGILIKSASKKYNNKTYANNDINLHLEKGKVIGLIGPNGSGKTTLINLILGRLLLDNGSIFIDGIPAKKYLKTNKISYIPQEYGLYEFLTVQEHIKHFASIHNYEFNEELFVELGLDTLRKKKYLIYLGERKKEFYYAWL
jgi:ABC-2 type transport system ATP-binding protein